MNNNIKETTLYVNKIYDNMSYYDLYGTSVFIFILITLFVFFVHSYCIILQKREEIASDWVNQRCKPQNLPFAGYIYKPDDVTAFEYTGQNFQYCVQNILVSMIAYVLQPFQYLISNLTNIFGVFSNSVNTIRKFTDLLRQRIQTFTQEVFGRILNVLIPFQQIFIALMDTFNKVQGIMTAGLYTMLGSYYGLQSLMGAIMELIIKMLSVLVAIIVGLWIMPVTWPAAASMSAVFLAIAIPLSIIVIFMSEVLHIKSSGVPKLRCFDKNTKIKMNDGSFKEIQFIQPGDILNGDNCVTSTIKVTSSNLDMYNLCNIIVSESHILKFKDKWIPVSKHPDAKLLANYNEPYLYCLNTSTKEIIINDIIFTDWDEIYDNTLEKVLKFILENKDTNDRKIKLKNIHKYLDYGLKENIDIKLTNGITKKIKDIEIGTILENSGIVYGIVKIDAETMNINLGNKNNEKYLYHLLVSNKHITTKNKIIPDYNHNIDFICKL